MIDTALRVRVNRLLSDDFRVEVLTALFEVFIAVRHVTPLPLTGRSPAICPASAVRTRVGQRTAIPNLFRSRPLGFVNRKMFSFRSNPALFMA
jgi:hypothetical protein